MSCVKFLNIKQDVATLSIDVITILLGFAIFQDWGKLLVGILAAMITSVAIKNIYGKFIDIQVVNHPELAAQGRASGRELWQLALMENATADFLRKNVIQDMHPEDVLDAIEDYIVKTLANLGAHFIRIRDTWNYGNGLELGRI